MQHALTSEARHAWLQEWREVYAAGLHAATGQWKIDGFEWHVFSFQHARARNSQHSLAAYAAESAPDFVVCPESHRLPAVRLVGARLPQIAGRGSDILVAPADLAWTMAFTHEETQEIGPYFSRREWIVAGPRREVPARRQR